MRANSRTMFPPARWCHPQLSNSFTMAHAPVPADMQSWKAKLHLIADLYHSSGLSLPADLAEARSRLKLNLHRFSENYAALVMALTASSLLSSWKALVEAGFVAAGALLVRRLDASSVEIGEWRVDGTQLRRLFCAAAFLVVLRSQLLSTLVSLVGTASLVVFAHASLSGGCPTE
jgi:hypothetical protein